MHSAARHTRDPLLHILPHGESDRYRLQGKVLFVAPTRPLVKQQYESCREVMGIPVRRQG